MWFLVKWSKWRKNASSIHRTTIWSSLKETPKSQQQSFFFSPGGSSLLQSPYINIKTKETKNLQKLLLGGSFVTFHTWNETPRDITAFSFRDFSDKSCYKTHLTEKGHVHRTKAEPSKQSKELLLILWSVTVMSESFMWLWIPEDWKSSWFFTVLHDENHPISSLQRLWRIQGVIQYFHSFCTSGP